MAGRYARVRDKGVLAEFRFQSSPGLMAGRYHGSLATGWRLLTRFQSSPGLMAGRYWTPKAMWCAGWSCFNPRPA